MRDLNEFRFWKRLFTGTAVIVSLMLVLSITSCNRSELADCPECFVLERTDIAIRGDVVEDHFTIHEQDDPALDLVEYTYYGHHAERFDIMVLLGDRHRLMIRMSFPNDEQPWEQVGMPYHIYPNSELEDKLTYVSVEFLNSEGGAEFASNHPSAGVRGTMLNVFSIMDYDGISMRCRLKDMRLPSPADPNEEIVINGTFVGAVTF